MKILLGIQISPITFFFGVETSCHVKKYMNYMYVLSFVFTGVLAKIAYNLSSKLMPLATKEVSTKKILMAYCK